MARQSGDPQDLFAYAAQKEADSGERPSDPGSKTDPLSVTQLVRRSSQAVRDGVGKVWLRAEVASLSIAASGHHYLVLSDDKSSVRAVMWKSAASRLRFRMEEGLELSCRGSVDIYQRDGKFQFYVEHAEPAGAGADAVALEQLRRKLAGEGLFDPDRKRALPILPKRIGVVTSRSGAAVRDIIKAVQRRFPVPILLSPAAVQGSDAPGAIARALDALATSDVEVIIVGRGGGSVSDLAAFNSEAVVRAIARARVPVISAVGHEIDTSLADLVADTRAATPTMAGEMAVPVLEELESALEQSFGRLVRELRLLLATRRQELDRLEQHSARAIRHQSVLARGTLSELDTSLSRLHPRVRLLRSRGELVALEGRLREELQGRLRQARADVKATETSLSALVKNCLARQARELGQQAARLDAMSPLAVLERGYAIASAPDGSVIREARPSLRNSRAVVRVSKGSLHCLIEDVSDD